ncbi:MAG: NAD-dependent deacylase [Candidatus Zixiibacteriota bacterium]
MLKKIARVIRQSRRCVVLTGAGISAESGVPTFRGKEGLWGKFRPEELATMGAFLANPKIVWEWYNWRRQLIAKVEPNAGHYALAEMSRWFRSFTLVTQNVDNLHRLAGSTEVLELHGNIYRNKCAKCGRLFEETEEIEPSRIPACRYCGGAIRPDVVWFGEMLPEDVIDLAFRRSEEADLFLSVGTSALVHPAATLPVVAKRHGAVLVEINPEPTPLSELADYAIQQPAGQALPALMNLLREAKPVA